MPRLLLLALLAALVALPGCGGGDDEATPEDRAGTATQPAPSPGGDRGEARGLPVEGTGYTLRAPAGWDDHSDDAEHFQAAGLEPDVVLAGAPREGFAANINVLRQEGLPDGVDVERFADVSHEALRKASDELTRSLQPSDISEVRELELDGEEARAFDYSGESRGVGLRFRQVFAVRDGAGYIVTYTDRREAFDEGAEVLDAVLATWDWEE